MTPAASTASLVRSFCETFTGQLLTGAHAVASPLGLWLLLATLAPAASGPARTELEELLGTDAPDAAARAGELLASPHPAVGAAVAAWADPSQLNDTYRQWADRLPVGVETGPVPTQAQADEWARTNTRGLIERFPAQLTPDTVAVLASALVTQITWTTPFHDATAGDLAGAFGDVATAALQAPDDHERFLAYTPAAGIVGVHTARSGDGLVVLSVIADPDTAPADVHAAAGQVAELLTGTGTSAARKVGLWDVRVGTGHAWTVTESHERFMGPTPNGKGELVDAVLPAWKANTDLNLTGAPGVPAAFATLEQFLPAHARPGKFDARQSAVASYRKDGFDAAAVTAVWMRAAAALPALTPVRRATIRFNRPYAVLAIATNRGTDPDQPWNEIDLGCRAWDGLPVFSAWVTVPD